MVLRGIILTFITSRGLPYHHLFCFALPPSWSGRALGGHLEVWLLMVRSLYVHIKNLLRTSYFVIMDLFLSVSSYKMKMSVCTSRPGITFLTMRQSGLK